jgi:hypothetical protein
MAGMAGGGIRAAGEALAITVGDPVIMADAGGGTMAGMVGGTVGAGMVGAGMVGDGTAGKLRSRPFGRAQMTARSTSSRLISSRRHS